MPDIKFIRTHSLPIAKAKARAQIAAARLAAEYGVRSEWHGNMLRLHRSGIDGQIDVTDSEVRLDVTLSALLRPFKGKLVADIERDLDRLFG
jgi:putative polyhydroxyalkanoate system protein